MFVIPSATVRHRFWLPILAIDARHRILRGRAGETPIFSAARSAQFRSVCRTTPCRCHRRGLTCNGPGSRTGHRFSSQSAHQSQVFHERNFGKAAERLEDIPPNEDPLGPRKRALTGEPARRSLFQEADTLALEHRCFAQRRLKPPRDDGSPELICSIAPGGKPIVGMKKEQEHRHLPPQLLDSVVAPCPEDSRSIGKPHCGLHRENPSQLPPSTTITSNAPAPQAREIAEAKWPASLSTGMMTETFFDCDDSLIGIKAI